MPDTITNCQHSKDGVCQVCAMNHEREILIVKALNLGEDDPFANRVLRYLEVSKTAEKALTEFNIPCKQSIQKEVRNKVSM